jgi:2-desacetyl-2-hydroxyethyl bacteriochlorophyllide A dehydrogenase
VPADRLLKVPDAIRDDHAPLIEPLAVATHDVTRAQVKRGDTVVVFGGGPIGTLIALVCRHRGARLKVVEINPYRIGMLQRLGFDTIGPDRDVVHVVKEWTDGTGADAAFEVTGDPAIVHMVSSVVRVWGTISIIAIHPEPVAVDLYAMFARELTMLGSRLYTRGAWEEAIRLIASGDVVVDTLVTRIIPLEGLQAGMEEALAGGPVMKVIVGVKT